MTEEELDKLYDRLLKGAEYLSNPLLTEEDRNKAMQVYNEIERKILKHKGLGLG